MILLIVNILATLFLYFNWQILGWSIIGILSFLIWWLSASQWCFIILQKVFLVSNWLRRSLAWFMSLFILVFVLNIFTSWLVLNDFTIFLSLIISGLILFVWYEFFSKTKKKAVATLISDYGFKFSNFWLILGAVLWLGGWCFILISRNGGYLVSPWQALPVWYLLIFFILLNLVLFLVFSKKNIKLVLVVIVLFSLLTHAYLLVYQEGFGGDRWRHLGSEYRIINEMEYQPTLLSNDIWQIQVLGATVPQALLSVRKLSYGFDWSLAVLVSKVIGIDVYYISIYLGPLIWSIFLPLLAAVIAWLLWPKKEFVALTALMTNLFYLLQYYGSQTLSISYSLLFMFLLLALWLSYLKSGSKKVLYFNLFLTGLMYFGYFLSLIIGLMVIVLILAVMAGKWVKYGLIALLAISIPILEYSFAYNNFNFSFNWIKVKQLWLNSNLIYFESGQLLVWPQSFWKFIYGFLAVLTLIMIFSTVIYFFRSRDKGFNFLGWLLAVLASNYILSWIMFEGLQPLTRRLNLFISGLLVFVLAFALVKLIARFKRFEVVVILAVGFFGVLIYGSGPVLNATVTTDDTKVMAHLWQIIENNSNNYCVIAETWPLLALEAYSARQVVAGNFPSDKNHQQPERVYFLTRFKNNPTNDDLNLVLETAKANICFLALGFGTINEEQLKNIENILGPSVVYSNYWLWQINK